ncbi:MAG TPA: hypothetical protein VHE09_14640 [Rhizomicrobium sp.]|nr:hypothetical protein [Rhizomicrobium sp.]
MHSCPTEIFDGIKTASFSKNEAGKNPGIPPFLGITENDAASRKMMLFSPRIQNGIISGVMPKRAGKRWIFACIKTASKRHHTGFAYRHHHASTPYRKGVEMMQAAFCRVVLQAWTEGVSPPARDFRNAPRGSGWPLGAASERDRPPARSDALIPEHIRRDYVFAPENPSNLPMQRRKARSPWPIMQQIMRRRDECTLATGLASPALRRVELPGHPLRREDGGVPAPGPQGPRASMKRTGGAANSPDELTRIPKIFCSPHMRPLEA